MGGAAATCRARSIAFAGASHPTRTVASPLITTRPGAPATMSILPRMVETSTRAGALTSKDRSNGKRCADASDGLIAPRSTASATFETMPIPAVYPGRDGPAGDELPIQSTSMAARGPGYARGDSLSAHLTSSAQQPPRCTRSPMTTGSGDENRGIRDEV